MSLTQLIHVRGDHPIFAYVDKYLSSQTEVNELVTELKRLNYENILINGKELKDDAASENI